MLDRVLAFEHLRAEIEIGIREADAGLAEPLDFDDVIRRGRERLASR
jgi:hypothetical protein